MVGGKFRQGAVAEDEFRVRFYFLAIGDRPVFLSGVVWPSWAYVADKSEIPVTTETGDGRSEPKQATATADVV